jgi:hypothetical protein
MAKKDFVARGSAWIPRAPEDGTSVTILYTKVLYQVSASPTDIPTSWVEDIKNAIQTDSKPYLWSKTIVAYSDNNKTATFSVSYKGKDGTNGTSFTPKGTATGFFYNMSSVPSCEDGMDSDVYIVNVDDRSNPTSELPPYVCHFEYENFIIEHAEFGDGYNVKGHLYVANSNEWVDFGEIQGAKGEKGDPGIDGKDAINIVFSPAELVFDADENGNLVQAEKSAEVKVFRGNKQLTYLTDWDNDAEIGDNCRAALLVNTTTNKPEVKISGITSSNIDDVKVPATSGGANVSVIVDGVKYRAYLPFSVNVNTYANFLIRDNKKYISKYTEVSNKYDAVSSELKNKADLKTVESTIEQTAENIKLEVLSKTSGRRNMLVNSAFRNQDSVFIHSLARIEKNTGVDGVNCIHSKDTYSGTGDGNYIGAFWDSTQKNGVVTNIPISKGKKYVISCWIKSDNKDLPFVIECFFMNSINQQNRGEDTVRKEYHVDNVNEWKRIDFVVDTTDTSEYASKVTPYLAVNFWSNNKNVPKAIGATDYPPCHAYICKPMMEEGDTYGGWTLSDSDYDYVGGNIIDNARTLEVGGSLKSINESNVADYSLAYYGDSMSLRINNTNAGSTPSIMTFSPSLEVGVDYMFSFLAKGTANIGLYALCDNSVDGDYLLSEDSVNAGVREIDTLKSRYAPIVLIPTQLTTEYKRYWGHMRFYGHVPTKLYLQLNNAGEVYICQPKLEIGATMTEFTERKTDLVDKASLKKAGIEITTDKVKLYGDKIEVVTTTKNEDGTSTDTPTAMFSNGKLNASLIDADAIEVKHLWAKSEDGTTKVGYFGNTEKMDACKVDDTTYAPLFIGANNAKNAPFHVTQEGAIYALMGRIGKFSLTDDGIFEYNDGYNTTHKPMRLSENLIYFTHSTDHTTNDRMIWMGNTIHSAPTYGISNLISDIWIDDRESRPTYSKVCLLLHAEGGTSEQSNLRGEPSGNFAICASKGMYAGFRPMTRTISKSMALSELDCYVEVTAAVTLTLPANPQRGQTYWIMRSVAKGVKTIVKGNGKQVYTPAGNGETVEFTSANEIIWLTYIKNNWKALWITP